MVLAMSTCCSNTNSVLLADENTSINNQFVLADLLNNCIAVYECLDNSVLGFWFTNEKRENSKILHLSNVAIFLTCYQKGFLRWKPLTNCDAVFLNKGSEQCHV